MIAATKREIADAALFAKANFNPAQPRVTKRNPGGGRWTRDGAPLSTDLSAVRRRPPGGPRLPGGGFHNLSPTLDQQVRYAEATRGQTKRSPGSDATTVLTASLLVSDSAKEAV